MLEVVTAWFAFSRTLTHSSFRLFFRLCMIKQKHGKALKKLP